MIKECLAVGSDSLFNYFRNKTEICNAIHWHSDLGVGDRGRVAQLLRCCATNRNVAGSIPAGVIGIFH